LLQDSSSAYRGNASQFVIKVGMRQLASLLALAYSEPMNASIDTLGSLQELSRSFPMRLVILAAILVRPRKIMRIGALGAS
jgi:hypothetical protein